VTRSSALTSPQTAAAGNVTNDQQRNIDSGRIANKTTIKFDATTVEFGAFAVDRHLMHPIFQWLDYQYKDYGGFGKVTDDRIIGGFRNRLVAGVNVVNGEIDNKQYQNIGGYKARCCHPRSTSRRTPQLTSKLVLLPAECRGDRRHAVPVCDA
jgi:iron complex outermembrane receptor protein